jgi:hypothetical protein
MISVSGRADPVVRRITTADIAEALSHRLRDFQAVPLYGLGFCAFYAAGGIAIVLCLTAFHLAPLPPDHRAGDR